MYLLEQQSIAAESHSGDFNISFSFYRRGEWALSDLAQGPPPGMMEKILGPGSVS